MARAVSALEADRSSAVRRHDDLLCAKAVILSSSLRSCRLIGDRGSLQERAGWDG